MRVALMMTMGASRKEPLAEVLDRVYGAFISSGQGEPAIRFMMADSPLAGGISSVDRVLKRFPEMQRFLSEEPMLPGGPPVRRISNAAGTPFEGVAAPMETLRAVAAGVPRSFPFHSLTIQFQCPGFGEFAEGAGGMGAGQGVTVQDSWWVNGRNRSLTALAIVEAETGKKKLPPLPGAVAGILAACGKVRSTKQIPLGGDGGGAAAAVGAVVREYRARMAEIVERCGMPHRLPPVAEAIRETGLGETGPKKPVLEELFGPMGYDCRGETGLFRLTRRTAENLAVELNLDVGTWSNALTATFSVAGVGYVARLHLPPAGSAIGPVQYPIGDAARWRRLVENVAALVAELDRTFVPAVAAAAGPSPEWFRPST